MSVQPLPFIRHLFVRSVRFNLIVVLALALGSCGKKENGEPPSKSEEAKAGAKEPEVRILFFLAEEKFDYPEGNLIGKRPIKGFENAWSGKGTATVKDGAVDVAGGTRLSMKLDVSDIGPFREFIDDEGFIGKDGATLYLSLYQQLMQANANQVNLFEVALGSGNIHESTQFNTGNDTRPEPVGPFGLRVKRNATLAIPAPEEIRPS